MKKYDVEFSDDGENSLSKISSLINKNSKVLEFGPSHGRFTRFLKTEKECTVTIVEYDKEAGENAAKFAETAILGDTVGDIEKYFWIDILKDQTFDYIVFADVLEHLYDPWKVLKRCKEYLKEDGSLIFSVPNISHNAVLVDLWNDKFEYRETGILDNTHIRFFTESSLNQLCESSGYIITEKKYVYKNIIESSFGNRLEELSGNIAKEIIKRKNGNIFQFIYQLSNGNKDICIDRTLSQKLSKEFETTLYYDTGNGFNEDETIKVPLHGLGKETLEFCLTSKPNIKNIRFDPLNESCIVKLNQILLNEEVDLINYETNGIKKIGLDIFFTRDPQIFIEISDIETIDNLRINFEILDVFTESFEFQLNKKSEEILEEVIKKNKEREEELIEIIKKSKEREEELIEIIKKSKEREEELIKIIKKIKLEEQKII